MNKIDAQILSFGVALILMFALMMGLSIGDNLNQQNIRDEYGIGEKLYIRSEFQVSSFEITNKFIISESFIILSDYNAYIFEIENDGATYYYEATGWDYNHINVGDKIKINNAYIYTKNNGDSK